MVIPRAVCQGCGVLYWGWALRGNVQHCPRCGEILVMVAKSEDGVIPEVGVSEESIKEEP